MNVSQEDAARAATRKEVDLNEILDPLLATKEGDSTKIKRNLSHLPEVYGIQVSIYLRNPTPLEHRLLE